MHLIFVKLNTRGNSISLCGCFHCNLAAEHSVGSTNPGCC